MGKEIMDGITPAIINVVILIITTVIGIVGTELVKLLSQKRQEVIKNMGAQQYNFVYSVAESVYYAVEQQFKNMASDEKRAQFDQLLLNKVPYLKQEDIDHVREAVIGRVNSVIKDSNLLKKADTKVTEEISGIIHEDQA